MKIKPYDRRVQEMFQSNFFRIPRFQRPYSWDRGNIEEFWSDVFEGSGPGHFIGSMVVYGGSGADRFVVDGQQRLTTIIIFLAALRNVCAANEEPALAQGIQGIIERQDLNAQKRYVIRSETSYPYLQETVLKFGEADHDAKPSAEELGIQLAFYFATKGFSDMVAAAAEKVNPRAKKEKVRKCLEVCRDKLLGLDVITIELEDEDSAYLVFETLNTRGKDLEPKDLIKNHLTRLLPSGVEVDATRDKWNAMLRSLELADINVSTFLHHHWLSRNEYVPEKTLFRAVKTKVKKKDAKLYLDGLASDVARYRKIVNPGSFQWNNEATPIKDSLAALRIFKVTQPNPLLLSLLRALDEERISLKQARETINAIERFHFMYTAVAGQSSSGGVSKMYAAAARELTNEPDEQKRAKVLTEFRDKLKARIPDLALIATKLDDLRYGPGETRDRALLKYALSKIDRSLRKDAVVDYGKMTIEHIASQNPPAGTPAAAKVPNIGNLILVSEALNGKLKNKPFADKTKILTENGLPLDEHVTKAKTWGDAEIDARTMWIAKQLMKL